MANGLPEDIVLDYDHVGIYVSDLDRSIKWYSEILGYKLIRKGEAPARLLEVGGSSEWFTPVIANMQCGYHYLELYYNPDWSPYDYNHYKSELGTKHISYRLPPDKYDRFVDFIYEKGVKFTVGGNDRHFVQEPFVVAHHLRTYFLDPDGIPIEIVSGSSKTFQNLHK